MRWWRTVPVPGAGAERYRVAVQPGHDDPPAGGAGRGQRGGRRSRSLPPDRPAEGDEQLDMKKDDEVSERTIAPQRKTSTPTFTPVYGGLLQRKCACGGSPGITGECEECRKNLSLLQRATRNPGPRTQNSDRIPPIVHDVLRSSGQPLDPTTRAFFEPRFGHDFSQVRVHSDAKAAESAWAVNALAYTVGRDVVFGAGRYRPQTTLGRRLLTHELVHVAQQQQAMRATGSLKVGPADSPLERQAHRFAAEMCISARAATATRATLQRQPDETGDVDTPDRFEQLHPSNNPQEILNQKPPTQPKSTA